MLRRTEEYAYYMLGLAKLEALKSTLALRNLKFVNFFDDKFKIKWVRRTDLEIREVFIRIACVMHGLSKQNRTEIHNPCGWLTKGVTDFDRHGVRCDDLQIIEEFNDAIPPFGDEKIGKAVVIKIMPPNTASNNIVDSGASYTQLNMSDFPELGTPSASKTTKPAMPPPSSPPPAPVDDNGDAPTLDILRTGSSPLRHTTCNFPPCAPQPPIQDHTNPTNTDTDTTTDTLSNIGATSKCDIVSELRLISSIMRQLLEHNINMGRMLLKLHDPASKVEVEVEGDSGNDACDIVVNSACSAVCPAVCEAECDAVCEAECDAVCGAECEAECEAESVARREVKCEQVATM
jgi:hypothetical protein